METNIRCSEKDVYDYQNITSGYNRIKYVWRKYGLFKIIIDSLSSL